MTSNSQWWTEPAKLETFVSRATPLFDKSARLVSRLPLAASPDASRRLDLWQRQVADADTDLFERRLRAAGISLSSASHMLEPDAACTSSPEDGWRETLARVLGCPACSFEPDESRSDRKKYQPLPFEELYDCFVDDACERLKLRHPDWQAGWTADARSTLRHALLHRLASFGEVILHAEFQRFTTARTSGLLRLVAAFGAQPLTDGYREFVSDPCSRMASVLYEFPVLARLLAQAADQWLATTGELVERLACDREDLSRAFNGGEPLEAVVGVEPFRSDPHDGGRMVSVLVFAKGVRIVYKPKPVCLDAAFQDFLAWFNGAHTGFECRTLRILDRGSYGWVEFAAPHPCRSELDRRRYFERAGGLLALLYLLGGTDIHLQNLVAAGAHPVIVDLETLIYNRCPTGLDAGSIEAQMGDSIWHTALRTGLCPRWEQDEEGRVFDVSGLGAHREESSSPFDTSWVAINTDRMRMVPMPARRGPEHHIPFDDPALSPNDYVDRIVGGFRSAYHCLLARRDELSSALGPISLFSGLSFRYVHRPTRVYAALLRFGLQPLYLRDGVERSLMFDRLARSITIGGEPVSCWPLLREEHRALERADVPKFMGTTTSTELSTAAGVVVDRFFGRTGLDAVYETVNGLSERDCLRQEGLIRGAFLTRLSTEPHVGMSTSKARPQTARPTEPTSHNALLEAADRIAEEIKANSVKVGPNEVSWIVPHYVSEARRYQLYPIGRSLYDGECGVALFLAAHARIRGDSSSTTYALQALEHMDRLLRDSATDAATRNIGLGAGRGWGSIIYALTCIATLLDRPDLVERARSAALHIDDNAISSANVHDLMFGTAGALLALLKLHSVSHDATALSRANLCGLRLVETQIACSHGGAAWLDPNGKISSGLAHGAAGIAYALIRLHAVTGTQPFLDAARKAVAFESSLFDPAEKNWLGHHVTDEARAALGAGGASWCHGAPGIVLARLAGLSCLADVDMQEDVERGLPTTISALDCEVDHLCCGRAGCAEIIGETGRRLARPDLLRLAGEYDAKMIASFTANRGFCLHPKLPAYSTAPVFFQGTAGIGYHFLRSAHPSLLPCVLVWS